MMFFKGGVLASAYPFSAALILIRRKSFQRLIREELFRLIKNQISEANIVEYQSGEDMINAGENFDISFLDIEMGKVSGMDIARRIREQEESDTERRNPSKKH